MNLGAFTEEDQMQLGQKGGFFLNIGILQIEVCYAIYGIGIILIACRKKPSKYLATNFLKMIKNLANLGDGYFQD